MAYTFTAAWELSVLESQRKIVQGAITKYAMLTVGEESNETPNHAKRAKLAKEVLLNGKNYANRMALGIIEINDGVALVDNSASHTAINNCIATVWNYYAEEADV